MRLLKSLAFVLLVALASCGGGGEKKNEQKQGKGGVKYGGIFRYNETEYLKNLFPLGITEVVSHRIVTQVYEGLVGFDQNDMTVKPVLAENWTVDSTATQYTFKVRKGVMFHDNACFKDGKGRELNAQDVVYCLNMLCKPDPKNQGYSYFQDIIKGAAAYHKAWEDGQKPEAVEGVEAPDANTVRITLNKPYADFLTRLALPFTAVYPREAYEYYKGDLLTRTVGTGPFVLKALKQDETVLLTRNPNYWGKDEFGNQLPYLDGIKISFIKEDKSEMMEFRKGNLDMKYRLPFDMVDEILDANQQLKGEYKKFQLQIKPEFATQFYGFLIPDKVFANKNVRLAFNYAIDRASIADYTAKGEGVPAFGGMVPVGLPGYDNNLVKGYTFDVKKAKDYLAKAGYPEGKGFPKVTLEINSGGGRNEKVAEVIQKMLQENLNIDVEITQLMWPQHINNLETGKTNFWRLGWVADYPDPINFLENCYGKIVPKTMAENAYKNSFRYVNADYDKLFEQAMGTTDAVERNKIYAKLDQMIVDDAPALLIYYSKNRRLLQPYVKNFPNNGMEYRNFREVWFNK